MNDTKVIMSPELQGLIPDLESESTSQYSSSALLNYNVVEQNEAFSLLLIGINDKFEFTTMSDLGHAIKMFKNKDDITLENINVIYQNSILPFGGQFKIKNVGLKNIDSVKQSCILNFSLSDKQVIF